MKIQTTFWSAEIVQLDNLLFINGKTKEIIFRADLDKFHLRRFFKDVADFVISEKSRQSLSNRDDGVWFQFGTMIDGKIVKIVWFDLVIDNDVLSYDLAFSTPLLSKNGQRLPFGSFPMAKKYSNRKLPNYRELKMKRRVFKYIANYCV